MSASTAFLVKLKVVFGIVLLLIAALGFESYLTINRLIVTAQIEHQTNETLVFLERFASSVKTAESTLRQYHLSGKAKDEQNFIQALSGMQDALGRLSNPYPLPEQALFNDLIAQRTALGLQVLTARKSPAQIDAATNLLTGDLSRQLRQRTDALLNSVRQREDLNWNKTKAYALHSAQLVQQFIIAGALLLMGILFWIVYVVKHYEEERKQVVAKLHDSEAMSRIISEGMVEGVITTTSDDIVLEANSAALHLFGYEKSELVGRDVSELIPQRLRSEYKTFTAALSARPDAFRIHSKEVLSQHKDGREILVCASFGDVQLGNQRLFTAVIYDITESKRISRALQASEAKLRQIADTVPALIASVDRNQRFSFHNKAYEEVYGLGFEQINDRTLLEVLGASAYASIHDKVEEVLRGYPVRYERVHTTPKGDRRIYVMQYFPRYSDGVQSSEVIGFFSLGTDITELRRIDQMKTEFVSTVSHELRTPLTSIRGSLGLIAGGVAGELPVALKSLVDIAKNNCERLIRLINDMLDTEKIESGNMRLNLQPMDIKQVIQQALLANEGFANQHHVKLVLQAPDDLPAVGLESDRMIQVMTNLLSNAVKFSTPESAVIVKVSRLGRYVRVEVIDRGPGIPEEFRGRIFQKFSQADSSNTRQKSGTGLGLNISRGLIEKMGGHIGFHNNKDGGATFFFELPEW